MQLLQYIVAFVAGALKTNNKRQVNQTKWTCCIVSRRQNNLDKRGKFNNVFCNKLILQQIPTFSF
jgi:hypothetical protein